MLRRNNSDKFTHIACTVKVMEYMTGPHHYIKLGKIDYDTKIHHIPLVTDNIIMRTLKPL